MTPKQTNDSHPDDSLAPIDVLAIEFPDGIVASESFDALVDLVDKGTILLLDLEFVVMRADRSVERISIVDLPHDGNLNPAVWEGASSGLMDDDDLHELANNMTPGAAAAIIVFENRWVLNLLGTPRPGGPRLLVDGGVPAAEQRQS